MNQVTRKRGRERGDALSVVFAKVNKRERDRDREEGLLELIEDYEQEGCSLLD